MRSREIVFEPSVGRFIKNILTVYEDSDIIQTCKRFHTKLQQNIDKVSIYMETYSHCVLTGSGMRMLDYSGGDRLIT